MSSHNKFFKVSFDDAFMAEFQKLMHGSDNSLEDMKLSDLLTIIGSQTYELLLKHDIYKVLENTFFQRAVILYILFSNCENTEFFHFLNRLLRYDNGEFDVFGDEPDPDDMIFCMFNTFYLEVCNNICSGFGFESVDAVAEAVAEVDAKTESEANAKDEVDVDTEVDTEADVAALSSTNAVAEEVVVPKVVSYNVNSAVFVPKTKKETLPEVLPPESKFASLSAYYRWRDPGFVPPTAAFKQGQADAKVLRRPRYLDDPSYRKYLNTHGFKRSYDKGWESSCRRY